MTRPALPRKPASTRGGAVALRRKLVRWFDANARDLPWRRTRDPYAILVSEFMLQQTTVAAVVPYFNRWLKSFPNFHALAAASEAKVLRAWEGLGYYTRARSLHRLARAVAAAHNGALPGEPRLLAELPGIGPYTLGAVASFAFDKRVPALDANVSRVLARLFDIRLPVNTAAGRSLLEASALALLPNGRGSGRVNAALMELGALLCRPGKPLCSQCPVRAWCRAREPGRLPLKPARTPTVRTVDHRAWITNRTGRLLLERGAGPRWAGLWQLPEAPPETGGVALETRYTITHHIVCLFVHVLPPPAKPRVNQRWFSAQQLEHAPLAAPFRKAIQSLLPAGQCPRPMPALPIAAP